MFGHRYQPDPQSGKLNSFLESPNFQAKDLFQIKNIIGDIKSNMSRFVKYIKTRKSITKQIIKFMTRIPEGQFADITQKRCCYYSTEFLSNDDDALLDLYFENETEEEVQEDIQELEIEKLLTNDQMKITDGNEKPEQYQILIYLMNYLVESDLLDEACNGYFVKAVNIIIRKRGHEFLKFLQSHRQFINAILKGIHSPSIGTLLVKILTIDDEKKEFKYEGLKRQIVQNISEILLNNLENYELCQSINSLIEDAFQTVKNKFFEYPEDFVRCINYFVSEQYTNKLLEKLFSGTPNEIQNTCSFLIILVKKMNTQIEDFISNQTDRRVRIIKKIEDSDFILKFEFQNIFNQFEKLLEITQTEKFKQCNEYTKDKILDFLLKVTKNQRLFQTPLNYEAIIMLLIELLGTRSTGIFKTEVYNLLKIFIEKSNSDLFSTPNGNQNIISESFFKKFFPNLLDRETDLHKINANPLLGIETNTLILLQTRIKNLFETVLQVLDINIPEIKSRYEKMLGGEHKKNRGFVFQDEDEPIKFQKTTEEKKEPQNIIVGKNKNIALPNLRYMTESKKSKIQVKTLSDSIEQSKALIKEIIEEQIVISHPITIIEKQQTKLIDEVQQQQTSLKKQEEQKEDSPEKIVIADTILIIPAGGESQANNNSQKLVQIVPVVENVNINLNVNVKENNNVEKQVEIIPTENENNNTTNIIPQTSPIQQQNVVVVVGQIQPIIPSNNHPNELIVPNPPVIQVNNNQNDTNLIVNTKQQTTTTIVIENISSPSPLISNQNIIIQQIPKQNQSPQNKNQNSHQQPQQKPIQKNTKNAVVVNISTVVPILKRSLSTQISKEAIRFYNKTFELIH